MKKLRLVALAAVSPVMIPAAMAQNAPPAPGAGVSWGHGQVNAPQMQAPQVHAPQMRSGGVPMQMQPGSPPAQQIRYNGPPQMHHGGPKGHGGGYSYHRVERGHAVSNHWSGGRYHVRNWGLYGFPQPFVGGRWIRYYDDALLVDQYGRVYDGRYGLDWDRYGEPWQKGDDGIPAYAGDGDYKPDNGDYDYAEDYARAHPGQGGYGYAPYGYAYGYGCGCPMLVTETTVTTAPVVEAVTTYHYVRSKARPVVRTKEHPVVWSKDRPVVRYK